MGASTFQCLASGDSLQDAYQNAVQSAVYSHGHEPYNGTISTTEGVVDQSDRWNKLLVEFDEYKVEHGIYAYFDTPARDELFKFPAVVEIWRNQAYDNTEKYGPCWGAKVESGKYIFAGWANS